MDFETFKMLKAHHFKEIIPNINDRIKFEDKFEKYFSNQAIEVEIDEYPTAGTFADGVNAGNGGEFNPSCSEQNYAIKTIEVKANILIILYSKIEPLNV